MENIRKENTSQNNGEHIGSNSSSNVSNNNPYPFGTPSYENRNQENPNSLSNYVSDPPTQNNLKEEQAYQILSDSTFVLKVIKKSGQDKATVTFGEISYKPQENAPEQKIDFTDLKLIKPDDSILKRNYYNFMAFLDTVEKELKSGYKKPNEAIIHLKFKMVKDTTDNYCINCKYFINDEDQSKENDFKDENFLNSKNNYGGLNCLITRLDED